MTIDILRKSAVVIEVLKAHDWKENEKDLYKIIDKQMYCITAMQILVCLDVYKNTDEAVKSLEKYLLQVFDDV